MKVKECLIGELEDIFPEIYDSDVEYHTYKVDTDMVDDGFIEVEGIKITVPELGVSLRQGLVCIYDADEDMYNPDFSISLIYNQNEPDYEKYLYCEQDRIQTSLFNYFKAKNLSMDEIGSLKCTVEFEC